MGTIDSRYAVRLAGDGAEVFDVRPDTQTLLLECCDAEEPPP